MEDAPAKLNYDQLFIIADILMGAAHSDGDYDGSEAQSIRQILTKLVDEALLPSELAGRLMGFDPDNFDVVAACQALELDGAEDRRSLLALVGEVTDADDLFDLREDAYLKQVAAAIGAEPEEYANLTVEVFHISSLEPPPLPE
jgi:uncharacterized tellurite resistance protein B-like protein